MKTHIKLDYDNITVKDIQLIFHHRAWLLKSLNCNKLECWQTTNGYHVKARIGGDFDEKDILLIQLLMGSDIQRDIYNFLRQHDGQLIEHWNRLYTKKYLILGTRVKEIGIETPCPELQERLMHELTEAKNWKGLI